MKIIYKPDAFGHHYHEYSIEGFCRRQSTAGEMAVVFHELHPEMDSVLGISKACESYKKHRAGRGTAVANGSGSRISSVLDVCNDLESRLNGHVDDSSEVFFSGFCRYSMKGYSGSNTLRVY